jgi:uncharacterized protein
MQAKLKSAIRLVVGWTFIVLGVAGLFLPLLQGILFLIVGLLILAPENAWARSVLARLKQRFPTVARRSTNAMRRARVRLGKMFQRGRG